MNNFIAEKVSRNPGIAALPAATRAKALQGRRTRFVRRLVSAPGSFHAWVSGPPMTTLEREQARLASIRNVRGHGTLLV